MNQTEQKVLRNMWRYKTEEVKFSNKTNEKINAFDRKFFALWLLMLCFFAFPFGYVVRGLLGF